MKRKPRNPAEGVLAKGLGVDVVYQGALITILTLTAYFVGHYMESGVWEIAESPERYHHGLFDHEHGRDFPQLQHEKSARQHLLAVEPQQGAVAGLWSKPAFDAGRHLYPGAWRVPSSLRP